MERTRRQDPGIGRVLVMLIGVAGVAMCITLLYHGGRAVMDVGGFCAEGGPYVVDQGCPDGSIPASLLGTFGLFLFGGMAFVGGAMTGGFAWLVIACWTALFAVLGWSFLEYGLFSPPEGEVVWGWLIPGVIFELMAWVPMAGLVVGWWAARRAGFEVDLGMGGIVATRTMPGPGQPARGTAGTPRAPATAGTGKAAPPPGPRPTPDGASGDAADFAEGSQALLDRLERLADMRDRGLLAPDEYETAKDAIMRELEARQ